MAWQRFAIFLSVVLSVYGGMCFLVYRGLRNIFGVSAIFKYSFLILCFSYPLVQIFAHLPVLKPGVYLTRAASFWLGVLFQMFFWFIIAYVFILIINLTGRNYGVYTGAAFRTALVISLFISFAGLYGALKFPETVMHTIDRTKRYGVGKKLRAVQLSDVHLGTSLGEKFMRGIAKEVRALSPDVLLITGDLVDMETYNLHGLVPILKEMEPEFGIYAITGNHEYISGVKSFLSIMEKAGIKMLENSSDSLRNGEIYLAGVNDPSGYRITGDSVRRDYRAALSGVPERKPCILLTHQPSGFVYPAKREVDLILAGHTHSGQVFPFHIFVRFAFKYITGRHRIAENTELIVSNGTGYWGPPMRFLAPSQIICIDFLY
ncbi:MAG: metallophosphoesterase [Fibrobacterota bacterium]